MAKLTPEEFADKHARRLKGALDDIRQGVERVTEAPTKKAIAKKEKMRAKLMEALNNGKWERGLARVTLDEWKTKMINKGVARIPEGIDEARDKQVAFASELLPYQDSLKAQVDKLPDVTLEDNINRMVTFIRGMSKFKRSK